MTPVTIPIVRNLVLVGGGHAHVHVLKSFGMKPVPGTRVTLITRDVETPYSGMIPGFVAGHYTYDECHIDLHQLARFAGARLIHDEAIGVDRAHRRVLLKDSAPVAYDVLSLDIGSEPRRDVAGAAEHAVAVKPVSTFADRVLALLARAREHSGDLRVIVVGAGAGGTELALALRHRLMGLAGECAGRFRPHIVLVSRDGALAHHCVAAQRLAEKALKDRDIEFIGNEDVVTVEAGAVLLGSGKRVDADEIVWVTQAGAAAWLADTGLALDDRGFVRTTPALRTVDDPAIFAAGDIASVDGFARPKAGVFAVRQGPPLARNLRYALAGWRPQPYRPQSRYLALIGTGDGRAIATRGQWAVEGAWAWRWKESIDRRWMRGYRELPAMSTSGMPVAVAHSADSDLRRALGEATMRCGGCGAKVGGSILSRVLNRLDRRDGEDVLVGLEAPDDAAVIQPPPGRALVQSVDFFRAFVDDPYVLGRIAVNHALGDLYAMGAEPHSALAVATVPYASESVVEDDLFRLLAGAQRSLKECGVSLIGGHSAEAAEMALGFAVNGFADPARIWRKSGLKAGDTLILTKPLGSGVVMAAAMRRLARASWIETALAGMCLSNRIAAGVLQAHEASGCTDVTGFGLIGHLMEMLRASHMSATLQLPAIPVLPGAAELFEIGQQSSLQLDNLRARHVIANLAEVGRDRRLPILFDPQTAGGLLASVPASRADACVAALHAAGYERAAIIGRIAAPEGPEPLVRVETC